MEIYPGNLRIQSKYGKIQKKKTPNTYTFHLVFTKKIHSRHSAHSLSIFLFISVSYSILQQM